MRRDLIRGFFGVGLAAFLLLGLANTPARAQILVGTPGFSLSIGGVYPGFGLYGGIPGYGYGIAPGYGYYGYPSYGYSYGGYGIPYGYGYSSYRTYGYPGAWGSYRSYGGFPGFSYSRGYSYRSRYWGW